MIVDLLLKREHSKMQTKALKGNPIESASSLWQGENGGGWKRSAGSHDEQPASKASGQRHFMPFPS